MQAMKPVGLLTSLLLIASGNAHADTPQALTRRPQAWFTGKIAVDCPPGDPSQKTAELKRLAAKRGEGETARLRWWSVGGPAYRWNELAIEALLDDFVTLPLAVRHLALVHAAIDDAVAAAVANRSSGGSRTPGTCSPSEFAAAASAAADVLGYVFPPRAPSFAALAEEAIQSRLQAGVEHSSDVSVGRELGHKVAALAIAHGKADGSDARWTGSVRQGPGLWQGTNPVAPMARTWKPIVLARADEFRPPPPPAFDSDTTKAALAELKSFQRTPKTNHRATYWEVFGGARGHALWNEIARVKLLEAGDRFDAATSARLLAALNVALFDAGVACWDAKYEYWYIRPSQLDPELKPLFPPPNHPSYPAAHGCYSTAAATVLAGAFPADRDRLLALAREAAEARCWAGIHYRFDVDAGQKLGRQVGAKVLERAFVSVAPGSPPVR